MKLDIVRDADHWMSPVRVMAFKAGSRVDVPKDIAEALIARGDAKHAAKAASDKEE